MFVLYKNKRKYKTFKSYEAARQFARKYIRDNHPEWPMFTTGNNPTIGEFGFRIFA
jgi:viroplasmin and RNaseH domain-containing protein